MARYGACWVERTPDMDSCIFKGNYAARNGGGLYLVDADRIDDFQLSRLHFIENKSLGFGGGAMISLGRPDGSSSISLLGCQFKKNAILNKNAALYIAPKQFNSTRNIDIEDCIFIENDTIPGISTPSGGSTDGIMAISVFGINGAGNFRMKNCIFNNNKSKHQNAKVIDADYESNNNWVHFKLSLRQPERYCFGLV